MPTTAPSLPLPHRMLCSMTSIGSASQNVGWVMLPYNTYAYMHAYVTHTSMCTTTFPRHLATMYAMPNQTWRDLMKPQIIPTALQNGMPH